VFRRFQVKFAGPSIPVDPVSPVDPGGPIPPVDPIPPVGPISPVGPVTVESAPVGPVKLGLEYITAKAESSDADKDGTKIGAFKKAEVPNTLEFNDTWTALTVSGAQPVGADSIVYALDYKMTTEDIKSAKNKFDLSGYGVDVGYKMADMYKGGAVTPGIKFKNSTQKADLPDAAKDAEETFADQSLQRVELYGKYTYASFTGSLVYRMDTAKGEVFDDSSNSAKKTKKASSAFVKLAYNF
jgi:hypothetical protein